MSKCDDCINKNYCVNNLDARTMCPQMDYVLFTPSKDWLIDIPAADVQPVRHGRWERASKSLMVCTACGNCVVDDRISGMFYCPNCGAKMDGDNG